jgi:hypothetical protein
LATGVLSGVLAYLPLEERMRTATVNTHWRGELQHPSLWRNVGWHLTRYVRKANALPLPPWLRARLSVVRCSIDWLLFVAPFERFRQLKNVRHLDLLVHDSFLSTRLAATDEAALRRHLSSLSLQSLRLPLLIDMEAPQPDEAERKRGSWLLSVLAQPEPNSLAPSPLARWSNSLTSLRCEIELLPDDSVLMALTAHPWPKMRKLQLKLHCASAVHSSAALERLHHSLLPSSMPVLTWLEVSMRCTREESNQGCACVNWWKQLLPGMRMLTTLKLTFGRASQAIYLLELLHFISADAMPQLTHLDLVHCNVWTMWSDHLGAPTALLQCMPLTQLTYDSPRYGGLQLLHCLPHLTACTLLGNCWAPSVAAASSLEELTCAGGEVVGIAERWWRRCGCPPLQQADFVDEQEWQQHLTTRGRQPSEATVGDPVTVAPVIRALRCGPNDMGMVPVPACAFPYLAHLRQLRELECALHSKDVRALGLLPQLEALRLWLYEENYWPGIGVPWSNDAVRTLGELPLHRLQSLRLEDESQCNSWMDQGMWPDDPDFPCQKHTTDRQLPLRRF